MFSFIKATYLYKVAIAFLIITLFIVVMIYINLYRKLRIRNQRARVEKTLEEWLFNILLADEQKQFPITPAFLRYISHKRHRQYFIEQLINSKKNLTGLASENIITLYESLDLRKDSIEKINSSVWHKKARGIYELYMMNQADMKERILQYTDSSNEYIRMESQTAIIGFMGFEGLVFLETMHHPLTNWQQVKLLEQLRPLNISDMPNLGIWLRSKNEYVVIFALKLAEIYLQMQVHDQVAACLQNSNEKIRRQAVLALIKIPDHTTASILREHYFHETIGNKKHILRGLGHIGTDADEAFLQAQLNHENDQIKLEAAKALEQCAAKGLEILYEKAAQTPEPFDRILVHVKGRLAS